MFQHAFRTLLYGVLAYALMQAIIVSFWGIWALRFRRPEEIDDDPERLIRKWLDAAGLSTMSVSGPMWVFGLLTTFADGVCIFIVQTKETPYIIRFHSHIVISSEHQAILKAMPAGYVDKLAQDLALKVFLARMVLATQTRLSGVALFFQLAITAGLDKAEFLTHVEDMHHAALLARETILLAVERAPRLLGPRDIRIDERR
jgi:hypothetical protein